MHSAFAPEGKGDALLRSYQTQNDLSSFALPAYREESGLYWNGRKRINGFRIKGWIENGVGKEKIYDVKWAGDRKIGKDGKLPTVGNTVDLKTGKYANTIGTAELKTVWTDPDFNPEQNAFYYVRVLEIPSPTWQLYDKVKYKLKDVSKDVPMYQQERAWSSPIWYNPK